MFNSGILDVAIGLVFIYLLLSLICSAINELFEAKLKLRASDLEQGLRELLQDPDGSGLTTELYQHPLIFGLFRGQYNPAQISRKGRYARGSALPSYIPSRNFALALMDIILPGQNSTVSGAGGATPAAAPAAAPAATTSPILGGGTPPAALQPLRDAINAIPNPQVTRALMTLVDAAGNDIGQARKNIEDWFDSSMDRLTGWYKRRSQVILLVLGLVVAVVVNVDTITIANSLSHDATLRNSLVAAASEYAKANAEKPLTPSAPTSAAPTVNPAPVTTAPPEVSTTPQTPEERVKQNLAEIKKLGLPIGWSWADERTIPTGWAWIIKIFGWVLTAAAVSLGAPFWFDLLNKFITARSTLKPEKSPGAAS